jgi:type VI secretion system secreted protein Hcp
MNRWTAALLSLILAGFCSSSAQARRPSPGGGPGEEGGFLAVITIPDLPKLAPAGSKLKAKFEVLSYSTGVSAERAEAEREAEPAAAKGKAGAKNGVPGASAQDLSVVKPCDGASPVFWKLCATQKVLPTILLEITPRSKKSPYKQVFRLTQAKVTSVRAGGSAQGSESVGLEEVSFSYKKIYLLHEDREQKSAVDLTLR